MAQKILPQSLALNKKQPVKSVAKPTPQPQAPLDHHINPATGVWDDNYYATIGRFKEQGGQQQVQQTPQQIIEEYTSSKIDEWNKKFNEYAKANPFDPDKALTEEKAKVQQRLDPYYKQTLNDYLQGVETKKSRSLQDESTILSELNADREFYSGQAAQNLDNALEQSREGFADAGLYGSGQQLRASGKLQSESSNNLSDYLRRNEAREKQTQLEGQRFRNEDLPLAQKLFERQTGSYDTSGNFIPGADEQAQILTGASQGVKERQLQNYFGASQAAGAYPGVTPQAFSDYNMRLLGA